MKVYLIMKSSIAFLFTSLRVKILIKFFTLIYIFLCFFTNNSSFIKNRSLYKAIKLFEFISSFFNTGVAYVLCLLSINYYGWLQNIINLIVKKLYWFWGKLSGVERLLSLILQSHKFVWYFKLICVSHIKTKVFFFHIIVF